ncbi:hypothetical protein, conserved in P.knowlesi [Plasmodium knowlesi strain H]|uniref:Transmembrane protein n=3 Tax=Plasmodium knowlesi TaxID=5850 RepID=A0A5K1VN74_PLAKH|nr:uncharacterized protein PKNH_0407100 [Plasmodium knowlesi strain H]OTN66669.1 Uncharacterized protein PKNOH_S08502000 [Plasmodium knowlesi]CAA9986711.1 hypothetical protein, conserved in P.knowlesi [Plasmodium knowlesi strain H]SBO23526.1 hypothetical protein, conserved in P.knowlesi [Plasmodium knowlesi strain H]SBO25031.1 hypothetical protein, conserved in P.knowlesi [Plasmodium knowlesi strain H]VVS76185.1 hypothetical protein, conserved in P.knowlesi [Plasmodium knowlesi strain H]|eukprot:XP_002257896.1 [Plasmodium knowlesi strain H]
MAPFSFIKTSTLIFAYLFLWYQTNYQHQVSALSTLKDDDISDGSGLYSSEEDINRTHGRAKTVQAVGRNIPPSSHQEESDDNDDVSTLLGSIDNELLEHTLSGQTPCSAKGRENSSKGIGTRIKECCKKLTHYKNKNKILLTTVLVLSVLYPLALFAVILGSILSNIIGGNTPAFYICLVGVPIIIVLIYFGILFWFYRSKVWVKCITKNAEIRKCLREEFEKVQQKQQQRQTQERRL